jgi:hypothetical protein
MEIPAEEVFIAEDSLQLGDRNPLYMVFNSSNLIEPLLESFMILPPLCIMRSWRHRGDLQRSAAQ